VIVAIERAWMIGGRDSGGTGGRTPRDGSKGSCAHRIGIGFGVPVVPLVGTINAVSSST
jgi:hypothetical protein